MATQPQIEANRPPKGENAFAELTAALQKDLAPEGVLEQTLASEIARAAWRLRRCANVEDTLAEIDPLTDAMSNPATASTQKAVDRARLESHRILKRSMDELRRLRNERQCRAEAVPDKVNNEAPRQRKPEGNFETAPPRESAPAERTQSTPANTPRNAPCPCGSGQKHKRCCGKHAPPVLFSAAA